MRERNATKYVCNMTTMMLVSLMRCAAPNAFLQVLPIWTMCDVSVDDFKLRMSLLF